MSPRKRDLFLPARTTAYVSRETGAAELQISPETWDKWVDLEILPAPAEGFPESTPRWRWADVDAKLARKKDPAAESGGEIDDGGVAGAANMGGKRKPYRALA